MVECPECGYEIESAVDEDDYEFNGPLDIEEGAEAILKCYSSTFSLGDRLVLEEAIRQCLVTKLGISIGKI